MAESILLGDCSSEDFDHFEVCKSVKVLNNEQLRELGTALGLDYAHLKRMSTLPGDMVDAWIKGMDNVLKKSGPPSWTSLIKALKKIDQEGVASTIMKEHKIIISKDSVSSTRVAPNELSERTTPELCPPAAISTPQPLPDTSQPRPTPNATPPSPNESLEGTTSMIATPISSPVPNTSPLPSEGTTSILTIPSPLPVPNASNLPRSPCEGTMDSTPPSNGLFSASMTQSSTNGTTTVSNDNSGKSATTEERFPYLKSEHLSEEEKGMLMGRLVVDSEDIRSKFSSLLIQTTKSFTSEKVSIRLLKIVLEPYKISELNESDDDVSKILLKAFHYCSLFSFKIVRDIIDHLGTNDDKERLAKYEASFKDYCKRRLCEVPTEVLNPGGSGEEKRTEFYVKTDEIFEVPLERIYVIQTEISKILEKPIHLKGMKEGCVELIFYLLHELDEIFPLNEKQMNLLKGIGVLRVYDEHKEYFSLSKDSPNESLKHVLTLQYEFQDISIKIFESIKALDVSRFRACLETLHIKYKDQHKEFFRQLMDFPEKDTTIDHIWTRLSGHWDFLNYTLLENLVFEFGDCTLKGDMGDYMKRLKLFRSSTRICDFAKYHSKVDKKLLKKDFQDLVTESKLSWSKSTLEDLEKMKENLTQQFSLPSFVMNLKDVQQGSIRITWRLPTLIASGLRKNLKNMDISEFYKENGIECIFIDSKEFSAGTKSMLTTPTQLPSGSSPVPSKQSSTDPSGRIRPCVKDASNDSDSHAESFQLPKDKFKDIMKKTLDRIKESLDVSSLKTHLELFKQLINKRSPGLPQLGESGLQVWRLHSRCYMVDPWSHTQRTFYMTNQSDESYVEANRDCLILTHSSSHHALYS